MQEWSAQDDGASHTFNLSVVLAPNLGDAGAAARRGRDGGADRAPRRAALAVPAAEIAGRRRRTEAQPASETLVDVVDLSAGACSSRDAFQRTLDVEAGVPFRARLERHPEGDRLILAAHHLVCDVVSLSMLVDEFDAIYRALAAGQPPDLELADSYVRFARTSQVAERPRFGAPAGDDFGTEGSAGMLTGSFDGIDLVATSRVCGLPADEIAASVFAQAASLVLRRPITFDLELHGRDVQAPGEHVVGWLTHVQRAQFEAHEARRVPHRIAFEQPNVQRNPRGDVLFSCFGRGQATDAARDFLRVCPESPGATRHGMLRRSHAFEVGCRTSAAGYELVAGVRPPRPRCWPRGSPRWRSSCSSRSRASSRPSRRSARRRASSSAWRRSSRRS